MARTLSVRGLGEQPWPELSYGEWRDTLATLHRWTQVVGKVKLMLMPMMNHFWQVALYVTSRGLTTAPIPYGQGTFEVDFDFLAHELRVCTNDGDVRRMGLEPRPVAEFYRDFMAKLHNIGVHVRINEVPQEIPDDVTPFGQDYHHDSYDSEAVERWHEATVQADRALKAFRARYTGKASPVHFFWGSFDLAASRYSGRPAPPREGADRVTQEAYCEEVSSAGFWPGTEQLGGPAFYSYASPEPPGYADARVEPKEASYDATLKEFILPYAAVRASREPYRVLEAFFQSTYEAAANLGKWDRARLERPFLAHPPRMPEEPLPRAEVLPEQLGAP